MSSGYMAKAMGATGGGAMAAMHTSFPATVVAYDEGKHTATVQPLYQMDSGENYPQIQNVPIFKLRFKAMRQKGYPAAVRQSENETAHTHAYTWSDPGGSGNTSPTSHLHNITYEEYVEEIKLLLYPGDLVLCVCSEKSIDSMASKQVHNPQSKRVFDVSDAIIVCLL